MDFHFTVAHPRMTVTTAYKRERLGRHNVLRPALRLTIGRAIAACVACCAVNLVATAHAANLTVGLAQTYTTIAAAVAASHDGDIVTIQGGTYLNDFVEVRTKITLRGTGSVHWMASGAIPNGKGILITDTDVTVTGIRFIGAQVSDADGGNGAGIRYQGGNLVISGCYFLNNQNGLLANPDPTGTITILRSEFAHNGATTGPGAGYTHNLYVGAVARLLIDGSYFTAANIGHEIKSRAASTVVTNTRIVDGPTGTASYSIDLPNGGVVSIMDNQIEQGPLSQNPAIISYGEEGGLIAGSSLAVTGNLIENDLSSGSARAVTNASSVSASVTDNTVYGLAAATLLSGPASASGNLYGSPPEPRISAGVPWTH